MKEHIWLVSWLDKDSYGNVEGYKTAVRATHITWAADQAVNYIVSITERTSAIIITNIGLADNDAAELIGKFVVDSMAVDWPE